MLTHDPKLDDPALTVALPSPRLLRRRARQQDDAGEAAPTAARSGVTEEQLARLHAPIGLPLGGRSPEEIALSILAEITATRRNVKA